MATSRRSRSTHSSQLTLLSVERPVSRSRSREVSEEWKTLAAGLPFAFAKLFLGAVHGGSFGRTSRTSSMSTQDAISSRSCAGLKTAGIRSHGESLTLNISESPKDVVECSLSDIIDTGDTQPQRYLSPEQTRKMLARLEKYKQENCLTDALRMSLSVGAETKRPSAASV